MFHRSDFAPSHDDTLASREDTSRRLESLVEAPSADVPFEQLVAAHASILALAEEKSGTTLDAHKRAVIYYSIYEDSQKNLLFPMIAAHGSLWGVKHTRRIDKVLRRVLPLSRHGRVDRWMQAIDAIRDINRRVFVEIYSTFYFTRFYGKHPRAGEIIKPEVLSLYNRVHQAIEEGRLLSYQERRSIYYDVFVHEQNDIVDPGIQDAVALCDAPLVVEVLKRVRPRFAYFPRRERLLFTDFTDVEQRNREGLRACDFAEEVGDARVLEAMSSY